MRGAEPLRAVASVQMWSLGTLPVHSGGDPAKAFCGTDVQFGSGVELKKPAHPSSVRAALACAFEPTAPNPVLLVRGAWHFALAHESSFTADERRASRR